MRKKLVKTCMVFLCIALLSIFTYQNRDDLLHSPFTQEIAFENISKAIMDQENSIYLLDKSLKRVMKIRQDGSLVYQIDVNEYQEKKDHLAKDIAVDENGHLYILNMVLNQNEVYLEGEDIVRYSRDGRFERIVHRLSYPESKQMTRPGRLQELRDQEGSLLYYDWDGLDITLKALSLNSWRESTVFHVHFPTDPFIANLSGTDANQLYYTTKRAELIKRETDQNESMVLYQNGGNEQTREAFPVYMDYQAPYVYFVDIGLKQVIRLNALTNERRVIASTERIRGQGYDMSLTSTKSIRVTDDNELVLTVKDSVVRLSQEGVIEQIYNSARIQSAAALSIWLAWGAALLTLLSVLYLLRLVYVDWLQKRIPFMLKQIVIFTPILFLGMVLTAGFVYSHLSQKLEEEIFNKLKMLAHVASTTLDKDEFLAIEKPADFKKYAYNDLEQRYRYFLQGNGQLGLDSKGLYTSLYRWQNDRMYVMMYYNTSVGTYYPIDYSDAYDPLVKEGKIVTLKSKEADGEWMFALAPIYDKEQRLIGMQEVGMTLANFNEDKRMLFWSTIRVIAVLSPVILAIFLILTYFFLSSIRQLRNSVVSVANGNWHVEVSIKTRDEVGELGDQFNLMARYIRKYIADINRSNEAYFRFVPQQFLQDLGKESILDVQLGDQKMEEMTILIADIRSFFEIAQSLSAEESLSFLNASFKQFGPVIRKHDGFVSKYLPSGLFALFPEEPLQAVHAAVAMLRMGNGGDEQTTAGGDQPTEVGMAIHRGPVMLGIIGEEKRMESGVISEHVTIATVLEKQAKLLGSQILVSDSLFAELAASGLNYRDLGLVHVEEQQQAIRLYDVFEADPAERRNSKARTKPIFEEAVQRYQQGRFLDARELFVQILRIDRDDQAAKWYFYAADLYSEQGAATDFDGALQVNATREVAKGEGK